MKRAWLWRLLHWWECSSSVCMWSIHANGCGLGSFEAVSAPTSSQLATLSDFRGETGVFFHLQSIYQPNLRDVRHFAPTSHACGTGTPEQQDQL